VSDQSGARLAGATIHLATADGSVTRDVTSDAGGRFVIAVPAGAYSVVVSSPGFDPLVKQVRVGASTVNVDAVLLIAAEETVQVNANTTQLSTAEDANKDALDLSGNQLATLSDDDATFQQQLLALAGGNGERPPQVYVDGFSGGNFPPKSAIREIKINQNPYSAEYDSLGFGRIEIFTKPGTGKIHGEVDVFGDPSSFNSQSPYLCQLEQTTVCLPEPSYYRVHTRGNVSGPIDKKTSFFVSADYYDQQNNAIINAQTVQGNAKVNLSEAVPDPQGTGQYSARLDRQWSTNNTFTGRYEFDRVAQSNAGLSTYVLPSEAYNSAVNTQTLQLGNTQVIGAHAELDTRFEWIRTRTTQDPVSNDPAIMVQGTVSAGGAPTQVYHDNQDHFEFQENGTYEHGKHFIRAGVRYRLYRDANLSTAGFNGTFDFNTINDYLSSALGNDSASQFQITRGKANFSLITGDLGLWLEDEWKFRKSLTADLGFRFESQSAIPDHADPSPHVGLAWSIHQTDKKPALVVLRTGAAIFYDRFPIANLMTAVRQNNPTVQQTYTVTDPGFYFSSETDLNAYLAAHPLSGGSAPTIYRVAPDFRSEYDINAGGGAEFNLGKYGSMAATYLFERGIHQWVSRNANAPEADGTRPYGTAAGDIYEFSSGAETMGDFFFLRPQINITKKINAWGFLMFQHYNTDTNGATAFASNSYDIHQDYGDAIWDRHRNLFTGADADLKWGLHVSGFLVARGGPRFNITTGGDNNNDTIYNDRPSFATAASNPADVVDTAYGNFDLDPQPGEKIIPSDYGHALANVSLQLQVRETWKFGPRVADPDATPPPAEPGKPPAPPDPRYALVFSVEGQNVTNTANPARPVGVLSSPLFGHVISSANSFLSTSAANRTIMLHTSFRF
jgi:hypothetical protein